MKKIASLFREEDGAVEMLQVATLLGFTAIVTVCLTTMNGWIGGKNWGKEGDGWAATRVSNILTDEGSSSVGRPVDDKIEEFDKRDMDDLMETVLHLTESGKSSNTCKDTTDEDTSPSNNMITVTEQATEQDFTASVIMQLEWPDRLDGNHNWESEDGGNFCWSINKVSGSGHGEVACWQPQPQSSTFANGSTVKLVWKRPCSSNLSGHTDFAVRVTNPTSGNSRMLKVRVEHAIWVTLHLNSLKDMTNEDNTPSPNMIQVKEAGLFSSGKTYTVSVNMKLDWDKQQLNGNDFNWRIEYESGQCRDVGKYWEKTEGTFSGGGSVTLNGEGGFFSKSGKTVFRVRVEHPSGIKRMLKVEVDHVFLL